MTVATAIDIVLYDATPVVIVHPYKKKKNQNISFCSRFGYSYCSLHSSGYNYG